MDVIFLMHAFVVYLKKAQGVASGRSAIVLLGALPVNLLFCIVSPVICIANERTLPKYLRIHDFLFK